MIWLTALEEDKAADQIAAYAKQEKIAQLFGIFKGGLPLSVKVSYRYDEIPIARTEDEITDNALIVEDIVHSGKTLTLLLERLRKRGVRPKVACWIWKTSASLRPDFMVRETDSKEPFKFPSETEESALASFNLSGQGR